MLPVRLNTILLASIMPVTYREVILSANPNFRAIKMRKAIEAQMMKKFGNVLDQYEKQINQIEQIFHENRSRPLISKGQPPVTGAINWEKSLFHRMKHAMLRFCTIKDQMETPRGLEVQVSEFASIDFE